MKFYHRIWIRAFERGALAVRCARQRGRLTPLLGSCAILISLSLCAEAGAVAPEKARAISPLGIIHGSGGFAVSFSPDGSRILTAAELERHRSLDDKGVPGIDASYEVRIWDAISLKPVTAPVRLDNLISVTFSSGGKGVLACTRSEIRLWEPRSGKPLALFPKYRRISIVSASADGTLVAAGVQAEGGAAGWLVVVFDAATGMMLHALQHRGSPEYLEFARDGSRLLTVQHFPLAEFRVWDVRGGREAFPVVSTEYAHFPYPGSPDIPASFSPDGTHLVIAEKHGFSIYSMRSGRRLFGTDGQIREDDERGAEMQSVVYTADGKRIFAIRDSGVSLWDPPTVKRLTDDVRIPANPWALSNDGSTLLTKDGTWEVATGRQILTFDRSAPDGIEIITRAVAFSPDGRRAATADVEYPSNANATTRIWDLSK